MLATGNRTWVAGNVERTALSHVPGSVHALGEVDRHSTFLVGLAIREERVRGSVRASRRGWEAVHYKTTPTGPTVPAHSTILMACLS